MTGILPSYLMAVSMMLFSACSGLTLIYAIRHVDPPHIRETEWPKAATSKRKAA